MVENPHRPSTQFHCIKCGRVWGEGKDINSYGVCPICFIEWACGKIPCFASHMPTSIDCRWYELCKECYEFRQDLLRGFPEDGQVGG